MPKVAKTEKPAKGKALAKPVKPAKKEKKKKDPNAPKRPLSGYMFFCADKRESIKEANEGIKVTEITSKLGAAWKVLTEKEKEKYQAQAEKDKKRYAVAVEAYKGSAPAEEAEEEEEEEGSDE